MNRLFRLIFWCTAPLFLLTMIVLPLTAPLPTTGGVIMLVAIELLSLLTLLGLYDPVRFEWCLRGVGMGIFLICAAYLAGMLAAGNWLGNGRKSSASALNAAIATLVFGVPGLRFAILGWGSFLKEDLDLESEDSLADEEDDAAGWLE